MKKTRIALFAALYLAAAAQAQNLIQNGTFQNDISPWNFTAKVPTDAVLENGSLHLHMETTGETPSHRMLVQKNLPLASNTKYMLRFDAISEAGNGEPMKVSIARSVNFKLGHYGLQKDIQIAPEWRTYEFIFTTTEVDPADPGCIKLHMGKMAGDVYIRNITLQEAR